MKMHREDTAAKLLQRAFRKFLVDKSTRALHFSRVVALRKAAVRLQAWWRQQMGSQGYELCRARTEQIQARMRQHLKCSDRRHLLSSVVSLQVRLVRPWLCRRL